MKLRTRFLWPMLLGASQLFLLAGLANAQALPIGSAPDGGIVIGPQQGERRQLSGERYMLFKVGPMLSGARDLFMGSEYMPPGSAIPVHQHHRDEEILFVHRGEVTVNLNDREYIASTGTTVYLPPGVWVGVENTGTEPAVILFVFSQPLVEHCFRTGGKDLTLEQRAVRERACEMTFR